jgi:dimethylaniline monooxygenase (N-oxide forming)
VGAGAAGLCAAKHLLQRGIDVTVFEMGSRIGGLWVYENDNGRSPAYASLHINSEAAVTSYEDFPFPAGTPLFPPHQLVRSYLEEYARAFGVDRRIRFNSRVAAVEPVSGDRWEVTLADGTTEVFDGVVVAPGHQAVPSHPPFRDDFTGEYRHVQDYRLPAPYAGKRVLVVGTGNSAMDVAADLAGTASTVAVVARSPALIMPRMLFGVPTSRVLAKLERRWMPWPLRRRLRELLATVVHGRMERYGLTTPKKRTHPTGHPTIMMHAGYGRVVFRPGIRSVRGQSVEFVDGRTEEFDVMLAATGYEVDLPFISPDVVPVVGRRLDLTSASSRRVGRTCTSSATSTSAAAPTSA